MKTPRMGRSARAGLGLLLGAVLCGSLAYAYWVVVDHRFASVAEGELYRAAAMPPGQLLEVVREHGIRAVIDLRVPGPDVEAERAAVEAGGVRYFNVPASQVPSRAAVAAFLDILDQPENRPALVHCEHGTGRAPLFAALYRIEYEHWDNERARSAAYWGSGLGRFDPGTAKGRFLLSYVPRDSGAATRGGRRAARR